MTLKALPINCTVGCPWYRAGRPDKPEMGGVCMVEPPKPIMVGVQQVKNPLSGLAIGQEPIIQSYWPTAGSGVVCGHHPQASEVDIPEWTKPAPIVDLTNLAKPNLSKYLNGGGETVALPVQDEEAVAGEPTGAPVETKQ